MNVFEVMSRQTSSCAPSDSMERAAGIMWDRDCGAVPVVDGAGVLHGIVTDRDLAMSAYLKGRPLAAIQVAEVMTRELECCAPTDAVERALASMQQRQVHRMPVVDGEGRLVGMLSLADVLVAAKGVDSKQRQPLVEALFETFAAVRSPRVQPTPPAEESAPAAPVAVAPPAAPPAAKTIAPEVKVTLTPTPPPATAQATPGAKPVAAKPAPKKKRR